MLLDAPDPAAFLAGPAAAHFLERNTEPDGPDGRWVGWTDLAADDLALLRAVHAHLVTTEEMPAQAAAKYVVESVAGRAAELVGFTLAVARAGLLLDLPATYWRLHPGYTDLARTAPGHVLVARGHPWSGCAGVEVVADLRTIVERTTRHLVTALEPAVLACRRLARVGSGALWDEVCDGFAMPLTFAGPSLPVVRAAVDVLDAATALPGLPWRRRPRLELARSRGGPFYLAQKGGCCLSYTAPRQTTEDGTPEYCSTCRFRSADDVDGRQVAWHEDARGVRADTL